ncbi:pancreatic polypeptide prohormone [Microcebus murinus]|uniref:pancreatic polypeptide prohormone n=1 Tax=Microcebus murinus TaxID=30608 RepID=UPI003F6D037A
MAATHRCISLLLLSTCVALLLQPLLGAQGAPMEPVYPGDDATPEQMAQYVADLRRYINMLTRPRCVRGSGKGILAPETLDPLHIPGHNPIPMPVPNPFHTCSWGKWSISTDQAWALVPQAEWYGKRDKEDTLDSLQWDSPHAAAPRELSPMDL